MQLPRLAAPVFLPGQQPEAAPLSARMVFKENEIGSISEGLG